MKAVLVESHEIAPEIRHFTFEVPEADRFAYKAGQFVSLSAPIGGRTITRAYSLASREAGNRFDLCLNKVEDGLFSPMLFAMRPGDAVDLAGPLGYFHWREPARDSILVATGTGIAPFRGMLQEALPQDAQVRLVFGVRYEQNLMYRDEFEALAAANPNFQFQPVLSRGGEAWTGRRGHVQQHVLEALGARRDVDVYMCGMKAMVDDLRQQLKALGVDRKQIIYEKYD